jgi:hypothetical protein
MSIVQHYTQYSSIVVWYQTIYQRVGTNCILGFFFKLEGLELSKCESYNMSHTGEITHAADRVSSSMYS